MKMHSIQLSREEDLVLEPILAAMSQKARHALTVPLLLEIWDNFVSEVDEGYNNSIYEYTNDLSVRDLLQEIIDNSPSHLRDKMIAFVRISDERFRKASKESYRSLLPDKEKSQGWWWFRVPIKLGSELKNDLQMEGLIK